MLLETEGERVVPVAVKRLRRHSHQPSEVPGERSQLVRRFLSGHALFRHGVRPYDSRSDDSPSWSALTIVTTTKAWSRQDDDLVIEAAPPIESAITAHVMS